MRHLLGRGPSGPRLHLLITVAAAFFLVPASSAFGYANVSIEFLGTGSGQVLGHEGAVQGEPRINCHANAGVIDIGTGPPGPGGVSGEPGLEECAAEQGFSILPGIRVEHHADVGSEFVGWKILPPGGPLACTQESSGAGDCSASGGSDYVIQVTFKASTPPQPLVIEVIGGGEVSGSGITCTEAGNAGAECEEDFAEGTEVPLTASEDPGWEFTGWTTEEGDAGTCTGTTTPCATGELNAPAKLKATFVEVPTQPLVIEVVGGGEVSGSGITCTEAGNAGVECEEDFAEGTEVPLTASEDPGWEFTGWTTEEGDAGTCTGTTTPCATGELNAPAKLKATFVEVPTQPLVIEVVGGGEVSGSGITCTEAGNAGVECEEDFAEGTEVPLTASEDPGWEFTGWTTEEGDAGTCTGTTTPCATGELNAPAKLKATFVEVPVAPVEVVKNGGGEGTVESLSPDTVIDCGSTCSSSYPIGESVTLKETPVQPGSVFAGWAGCTQTSPTECEAEVPSGGLQVTAIFIAVPVITDEPEGANCAEGGIKVQYAGETFYVCNGEEGPEGEQGDQGAPGTPGASGCDRTPRARRVPPAPTAPRDPPAPTAPPGRPWDRKDPGQAGPGRQGQGDLQGQGQEGQVHGQVRPQQEAPQASPPALGVDAGRPRCEPRPHRAPSACSACSTTPVRAATSCASRDREARTSRSASRSYRRGGGIPPRRYRHRRRTLQPQTK